MNKRSISINDCSRQPQRSACQTLSKSMREGLCLYDLKESELRLAHQLVLETYDCEQTSGKTDFHRWARDLGFWDAEGLRPRRCMRVFVKLKNLGLLDWNQAQGSYELRPPNQNNWSGLKRRGLLSALKSSHDQELPLRAERPLSEMLAQTEREEALAAAERDSSPRGPDPAHPVLQSRSPDLASLFNLLREGLDNREKMQSLLQELDALQAANQAPAFFAGNSPAKNAGNDRRKTPVSQTPENPQVAGLPAKLAGDRLKMPVEPPAKNAGDDRLKTPVVQPVASAQDTGLPAKNAGDRLISPVDTPAKNAGDYRLKMPVSQPVANAQVASLPANFAGEPRARARVASLAVVQRAKLAKEPPAKNAGDGPSAEDAWRALQAVDRKKTLQGRFSRDYETLCEQNPRWVIDRGIPKFEEHERFYRAKQADWQPLDDPVGWIGAIARDAGRMKWHGRNL